MGFWYLSHRLPEMIKRACASAHSHRNFPCLVTVTIYGHGMAKTKLVAYRKAACILNLLPTGRGYFIVWAQTVVKVTCYL